MRIMSLIPASCSLVVEFGWTQKFARNILRVQLWLSSQSNIGDMDIGNGKCYAGTQKP